VTYKVFEKSALKKVEAFKGL